MSPEVVQVTAMLLSLLIAMIFHEYAHAYVAYRLGDNTAKSQGRLTLNPLKHIDPLMTVMLPAALYFAGSPIIFGAAKPIPVNPGFFLNPRKGMLLVAIAGPAINFILAILSYALLSLCFSGLLELPLMAFNLITVFLYYSIIINVVLGLFNLIPVPPLDGSRILAGILPIRLAISYMKLEKYGFLLVIGILILGIPELVLSPVLEFLQLQIGQLIGP